MDDNSRAFARNMFRLSVHESDGQAFENLFVKIMRYRYPKFRPVKPAGSIGDKKNDGFDSTTGTYYQVYAPEDVRKTPGDALAKLKADFKGLKAFWNGLYTVKRFFFVVNDKYRGVSPLIEKELTKIGRKHQLDECGPFLSQDLEEELFQLRDDKIISVVGHVPMIDAYEFVYISGFSYFVGAWIDFEKVAREIAPHVTRGLPHELMRAMRAEKQIDDTQYNMLEMLRGKRNKLIHGVSNEIPPKSEIDFLVEVTRGLQKSLEEYRRTQKN